MEYKLIVETNQARLSNEVNRHLKDGWELYGSPTATIATDTSGDWPTTVFEYGQAVVRKCPHA